MYKKYKCLNIKKELLPTLPVTNFESGLKEEALKKKEASKKAEERNKCCMKQTENTKVYCELKKTEREEKKGVKPWWNCASVRTNCLAKCPKNKPPKTKKPQRCPDVFQDAYNQVPRLQNYLILENNRLYCHGLFNKNTNPLKPLLKSDLACGPKKSYLECRQKAASRMKLTLVKWLVDHRKRNEAYASNPMATFYTPPSQNSKNFRRFHMAIEPTCDVENMFL